MKTVIHLILCSILAMSLSNCKDDCNGTYTVNGTLWNGTKNKPHIKTKIDFRAGGASSLFSSSVNAKDLETVYTDESGKFSFSYSCIDEEDWSVGFIPRLGSTLLSYTVAKNHDVTETYNIPDSVSLTINFHTTTALGPNDTLFYMIGIPYNLEEKYFIGSAVPTGFYKNFRIPYKIALNNNFTIKIKAAKGRVAYNNEIRKSPENLELNNVKKLEPEVNEFNIYY